MTQFGWFTLGAIRQPRLKTQNIKLTQINFPQTATAIIHKSHLLRVFNNLLNNACDHIESLPESEHWININFYQQKEIEITISNGGRKIPQELEESIFKPYFTTKQESGGSGFGLNICKKFLQEMGADIVYDNMTDYPQFTLRFPLLN